MMFWATKGKSEQSLWIWWFGPSLKAPKDILLSFSKSEDTAQPEPKPSIWNHVSQKKIIRRLLWGFVMFEYITFKNAGKKYLCYVMLGQV